MLLDQSPVDIQTHGSRSWSPTTHDVEAGGLATITFREQADKDAKKQCETMRNRPSENQARAERMQVDGVNVMSTSSCEHRFVPLGKKSYQWFGHCSVEGICGQGWVVK